jgi:hypothetical protein
MNKPAAVPNRFCFADHAIVTKADGDGWEARFIDGSTRHLSDADLERRGFAIGGSFGQGGFYAILDKFREHSSYAYRVDVAAGQVWLENGDEPMPIDEFMMSAVRADASGKPVASFLADADGQLYACAANELAKSHASEIVDGVMANGHLLVSDWIDAARFRAEAAGFDSADLQSMVA